MSHTTIRMTLTGALAGKTIALGNMQFVKGLADFSGQAEDVAGMITYYTRSYQVNISTPGSEHVDPIVEPKPEPVVVAEPQEPNERQAKIIEVVNMIDKDEWVDKHATAHPKVKEVSELMEDPTVSKAEIVEVIEIWLS